MKLSVNFLAYVLIIWCKLPETCEAETKFGWKYFGYYLSKVADTIKGKPIVTSNGANDPPAPTANLPPTNQFALPNAPVIPPIGKTITPSNNPPDTVFENVPAVVPAEPSTPPPDDIFGTIITAPLQPLTNAHQASGALIGLTDSTSFVELAQVGAIVPPTNINGLVQCSCVLVGTCFPVTRIVTQNTGVTCPIGQQYCCNQQGASQVSATCGTQNIIPGVNPGPGQANLGQYPWSAIILSSTNTYIGGATLIDPLHLLTAAHLVANYGNGLGLKIRLGEWDLQGNYEPQPALEIAVANIIMHPSYVAATLQNDLAVITLQSAAPQLVAPAPQVNSICLPAPSDSFIGQTCFVAGWGKDSFTGNYQSIIKQVDVPVLAPADCQARLQQTRLGPTWNLDTQSFICAGGEQLKDACQGDGGNALSCLRNGRFYVVGITAGGIQCGISGVPGLYVNVANFLSWINANAPPSTLPTVGIDPRKAG